jgi:hypothetical protein
MDEIYIHPIYIDYIIINVGYTDKLCNENSLRKLYKNIGLEWDEYDSTIKILYIKYKTSRYNSADNREHTNKGIYWNCSFIDKENVEWIEDDESRKIYQILKDKIGNNENLPMSNCIVIKNIFKEKLPIYDLRMKFEENIASCRHCAFFPNVDIEADFSIMVDGEIKTVKYYNHDTGENY